MLFTTKCNLGDRVWTVDTKTMKIVGFTVGRINIIAESNEPVVTINPVKEGKIDYYTTYYDRNCFESKEALMSQLNTNEL